MRKYSSLTLAVAVLILMVLSSCNTTKHLEKDKANTKTETVVNTVTTKTITETATEDVKIKADSVIADIPAHFDNDTIIEENENIKLVITKDKKTGKVKAKAIQKEKVVPVEIKRVIVENTHENKKIKTHEIVKKKDKDVERTGPTLNLNYLYWLFLLLLIPLWRYRRQLLGTKKEPGS